MLGRLVKVKLTQTLITNEEITLASVDWKKRTKKSFRGRKGVKVIMVDVFNRPKGSYKDGKYDTVAVAGKKITSSIDAELQAYAERLMQNKTGAIVALEPSSGEISGTS